MVGNFLRCAIIGAGLCASPSYAQTTYEAEFATMSDVLTPPGGGQMLTQAQADAMDIRVEKGSRAHERFLLEQLKSKHSYRRSMACYYLGTTRDRSLGPSVLALAKSDPDPVVRISALMALGHVGGKESEGFLLSLVNGPYGKPLWMTAVALYRIDPKVAVRAFKARIKSPDLKMKGRGMAKVYMAACILDSDSKGEAASTLRLIHEVRVYSGRHSWDEKLETDAKARRRPADVLTTP